jgi:hypothetical protein
MKVYRVNQYEAYRADEIGVRYSINEPTNDTVYYKSETQCFEIELPKGFYVVTYSFDGLKALKYGDDEEVLICEDEKGVYLLICDGSDKKIYVSAKPVNA